MGRKRVSEPCDDSSRASARQLAHQQEHADAREHERREEHEVVAEDRVPREGVHRQDLNRLRQKVLRVRERQLVRIKDVRVPEAPAEMGRVPRQHPGDEQRIAEISGKVAGEAASERPRQCDGEDGVQQSHQEHIALFVHERTDHREVTKATRSPRKQRLYKAIFVCLRFFVIARCAPDGQGLRLEPHRIARGGDLVDDDGENGDAGDGEDRAGQPPE